MFTSALVIIENSGGRDARSVNESPLNFLLYPLSFPAVVETTPPSREAAISKIRKPRTGGVIIGRPIGILYPRDCVRPENAREGSPDIVLSSSVQWIRAAQRDYHVTRFRRLMQAGQTAGGSGCLI